MQIFKIPPRGFSANSYFVTADGSRAVCIDPSRPRIAAEAERRGLSVGYVLLTHGHFDHIGGCAALQAAGAKIGCLRGEEELALHANLGIEMGGSDVPPFTIDFTFGDGDLLTLCGISFRVIATPGHTSGGACYLTEEALFTGDTLFAGDFGRTDLPTGDMRALMASVGKLYALEWDGPVCPGHGEDTTLRRERMYNRVWKC